MELRKNPALDLERKRGMFFSMGLLISMSLVLTAFQWEVEIKQVDLAEPEPDLDILYMIEMPMTRHEVPKKPLPVKSLQPPVFVEQPIEEVLETVELIPEPLDETVIVEGIPELTEEIAPEFVDFAEVMPEPTGGYSAFYQFLSKNMRYPNADRGMGVQGKVFIQFVINEKGEITNPRVIKGISKGCDEEALRVIAMVPNWKPGKQGSHPVKVRMVVPINFVLN